MTLENGRYERPWLRLPSDISTTSAWTKIIIPFYRYVYLCFLVEIGVNVRIWMCIFHLVRHRFVKEEEF